MQKKIITKNSKKTTAKVVKTKALIPKTVAKKSPILYFQCMSDCCQKGLKGQKITQAVKQCKANAPSLIIQRTKQLKELKKALSVVSKFTQDLEKALTNH